MLVQRLAVFIFTMVPAIIGGGIIYKYTGETYTWVAVYEVILYALALLFITKGMEAPKEAEGGSHH
jgi:hypothetical protein